MRFRDVFVRTSLSTKFRLLFLMAHMTDRLFLPCFILPLVLLVLHFFALGIAAVAIPARLQPRVAQDDTCPVVLAPQPPLSSTSRIVGGRPSGPELASSMALLHNGSSFITGILIAPTVVLSYVTDFDASGKVYVGSQNGESGTLIPIEKVERHPSYSTSDSPYNYDLMFTVLASPAPSSARPVKVSSSYSLPLPDSHVRHVGYGRFGSNEDNEEFVLHQVDVPLYDSAECSRAFSGDFSAEAAESRVYCAGYKNRSCSFW